MALQYGYTYWYIECKTQDINLLDQRLRSRNSMVSQRSAVECPPAEARDTRANEDAKALFMEWIEHPCRPDHNVVFVDSTRDPEELEG